jgi:hypothetical protein
MDLLIQNAIDSSSDLATNSSDKTANSTQKATHISLDLDANSFYGASNAAQNAMIRLLI